MTLRYLKQFISVFVIAGTLALLPDQSIAQTYNYTQGNLNVDVFVSNPCNGSNNGFLRFRVNSANGGSANLQIIQGPVNYFVVTNIPVGSSFTFNSNPNSGTPSLPAGEYDFIIVDANGTDVINTFPNPPPDPATLTALPAIGATTQTLMDNTSCTTPNGEIQVLLTGGSKTPALPMGQQGLFIVTWTADNGASLPAPFTTNGVAPLQLTNLRGGTYTLTVSDSFSICGAVFNYVITEPTPTITVTTSNFTICQGTTSVNVTYSGTTNGPDQYSIDFNAAAEAQGFTDVINAALPASPIPVTVPALPSPGTYNGSLTVRNSTTGCVSAIVPISITVNAAPTINLVSSNASICRGGTSVNLPFSSTTGSPDRYSIDFNAAAEAQGFTDVVNLPLGGSPIVITVPAAAAVGVYNAILTITNSSTGCGSSNIPITVTVNANPTITLVSPNVSVCVGSTSVNLPYSGTTATPNQYSIDFDATAEGQGFIDVVNAALPASPIVINVPGAAAVGTYNATLRVRNSTTGCISSPPVAITITVNPVPTITLVSPNLTVCSGTTSVDLSYSGTTGSPNQYSIDFDATAEGAGFSDVVNAVLPASPIAITVPGAVAAGTYNATLTVRNSTTGCGSTSTAIIITVQAPTITLVTPSVTVCSGTTSVNLAYSATSGGVDEYSLDFNAAAEGQGFTDVVNAALPASPIVIAVPGGAAPGTYNATLTVRNSSTGCVSAATAITLTVEAPTITLVSNNAAVCRGTTSVNFPYSATSGGPNEYSIDFDGTAEGQGFADVVNAALPASPIVIAVPGAAGTGTYNAVLTVRNTVNGCVSTATNITITVNANPTITLPSATVAVCIGAATVNLPYSSTSGSPNQYSIDFNAAAEGSGFVDVVNAALPASPIVISIPGGATTGTYNATLTVRNSTTACVSTGTAITIRIDPNPTITLVSPTLSVCSGSTSVNLPYSGTTSSPNQYSIDFDATAEGQGFSDVVNAALPASPIVINVPGGASVGTYNATLRVRNSTTGCLSTPTAITITINPNPSISLVSPNLAVCAGTTIANLAYSGTTGSPNQYSIDFNAAAEGAGFTDVVNAALPASPISITVPVAAAAGTYNATLVVRNSTTGCISTSTAITVTINQGPTISLVNPNLTVCSGVGSVNLSYSGTTGSPDQYSIDFDAAAEAEGFTDVVNNALPASPIAIVVPGGAAGGTYNATLTVRNSATSCVSVTTAITITIEDVSITLSATNSSVCEGVTTGSFAYSATTGSPDQYSLDFDAAAEAQGFTDVVNAALTASPISITIPGGAAPGVYNAVLTVRNSSTGCVSTASAVTITVNTNPSISLVSSSLSGCAGISSIDLAYSSTTGSPDRYSIDYDAAAEAQGFTDVVNVALPASPIALPVPPAAAAGTYNFTITVSNTTTGCTSTSASGAITLALPAITVPAPDVSVCAGNTTVNLSYSGTSGGPDQYSIDFDPTAEGEGFVDVTNSALPASPIAITVPGAAAVGTYNAILTVRNSTNGCISNAVNITITVTSAPTAALSGDNTICQGESSDLTITLTGVGPWDVVYTDGSSNFTLSAIASSPHVFSVTPAVTTTYSLVSVADQCSPTGSVTGTATITVQAVAPPSDATLSGNATICSGTSTDLTVTITGGASPYTVTYSDGTTNTVVNNYTSGNAITVAPAVTTTYNLVSVTDANGCNALALNGTPSVTVNQSPTSAVLSGSTSICPTGSAVLSVTITDGTGPFSFSLDNGVGAITNYNSGDPINVSPVTTTTYSIVGNVTDANGCSVAGTGSATVTVSSAPTATLSGSSTICPAQSANLTATLTGVSPWNIVYTDGTSNFAVNGITSSPATIPVSPASTTTYTLVSVDDACGSGTVSGSATVTVRAPSDPVCAGSGSGCFAYTIVVVNAQTRRPSCANQNDGVITLDITGTTPGNYIIQLISSAATLTQIGPSGVYSFTGLSPDNYQYRVEDASGNICIQPYNLPIETSIQATASNFVDVSCFGTPTGQATFTVTSGGNSPYAYSIDGINWTTFFSGTPVTNLPPNGTYPVLIGDDANDPCPFTVMVTINNTNPQITIGLGTVAATCGNNDGAIQITTQPAGGTGGAYTYRLDGSNATPVNNTFSNLFGGNHTVTVIDNSGCSRDFAVFVPYPDNIMIGALNSTDASCTQLGSISVLIDNYIPAAIYEVAITTSITEVPTFYFTQYYLGNGVIQITDLSRGNYFVWVRTPSAQCPTLVNNFINNAPIVLAGPIPVTFVVACRYANGDLELRNITGATGIDFQYEVFNNTLSVQGTLTPNPLGGAIISGFVSGIYSVNLTQDQTSIGGCPTASSGFQAAPPAFLDTVSVTVPAPVLKLTKSFPERGTASRVVRIQESGIGPYEIRLELIQPYGAADPSPVRDWQVVAGQQVRYDNLFAGEYVLSLRDGYGCEKAYTVIIPMDESIFIPNIITPNGDGFNDVLFIRNLPAGSKIIISNRWGKQIYSNNDYPVVLNDTTRDRFWNGGNEADGIYYYRLQAGPDVFTGWIEILRGIKP